MNLGMHSNMYAATKDRSFRWLRSVSPMRAGRASALRPICG